MKKLLSFGLASIVSIVLLGATPSFSDTILLKVPVWFSTSLPSLGTTPKWVETELNKVSKGLRSGHGLSMKVYEPGKLVPPKEILESVSSGSVNAGYVTPGYLRGHLGDKGGILSAVPFGPDAPEFWRGFTMVMVEPYGKDCMTMLVLTCILYLVVSLHLKLQDGLLNQLTVLRT